MESLLTLLLLLALWLGPKLIEGLLKKGDVTGKAIPTPPPFEEEFETEEETWEPPRMNVQNMRETEANSPNEPDYFTYERDTEEAVPFTEIKDSSPQINLQTTDNEDKMKPELHFDEEELYKGIIYSEILKRKFN